MPDYPNLSKRLTCEDIVNACENWRLEELRRQRRKVAVFARNTAILLFVLGLIGIAAILKGC